MAFRLAPWLLLFAVSPIQAEPPAIDNPLDQQILEVFLGHVKEHSAHQTTPDKMAQYAAQPEDITWVASKYIRMALVAYWLTGEASYLHQFIGRMDALCAELTEGSDGYLGWYGLPLELFRHPDFPERRVDVMLTSFVMAGIIAEFATTVRSDEALAQRFGKQANHYLGIAEGHLVEKWHARGNYRDLGEDGAVYITHSDLASLKAHLTQPHNKHSKIGRSLILLYKATGEDKYLKRAIKLGTRFKRCLTLVDGHYEWNYWDPAGSWDVRPDEPNRWKHWIGAEHKGGYYSLSLSQAVLLYEHGLVFDSQDIDRFVRTQTEVCWNGNLETPEWYRVNGQPMDQTYLCSSLAPFSPAVYEMAFGARAQQSRLERRNHGWHAGVGSAGWLESKFLVMPRWQVGQPAEAETVSHFLSDARNAAWVDGLRFTVEVPGYQAPMRPAQVK